jgi:hypothetical protein
MLLSAYNKGVKLGRSKFFCSRSCSCAYRNSIHNAKLNLRYNGVPRGNAKRTEFTPFKRFVALAVKREPNSNITVEHLKEVWERQSGKCPYTGFELVLPGNMGGFGRNTRSIKKASLDRISSTVGYAVGNVQFVAVMANYAKSDYSHADMVEFCKAIASKWCS